MRTRSIRFGKWMCVIALVGCAQDGSAASGAGGGVEDLEETFEDTADPVAEAPESNPVGDAEEIEPWDPWAQPQQPEQEDPSAQPQQPAPLNPWARQPQPTEPSMDDPSVGPTPGYNGAEVPATLECPRGSNDFDGDGLCDAAEARCGTEIDNPDTDGDALSDGMEVYGIAFEGRTLDLADLGANPHQRDVFLEIDFTRGNRPSQSAINQVVAAFAAAGVNLHVEVDQEVAAPADIPVESPEQVDEQFKQPNLDRLRAFVYRWALFAHSYNSSGSSGVAPYANSWLLVTLGTFTFETEEERIRAQAGTLMHELGHTFNLRHGGVGDDTNFKPNHLSVMNYHYQFTGVYRENAYVLDYASIAIEGVNELSLNESKGFTPAAGTSELDLARYTEPRICADLDPVYDFCNVAGWLQGNLSENLDFNRSEAIEPGVITADLNGNHNSSDYFRPVANEWENLRYGAGTVIGNLKPQVRRDIASSEFATCQGDPNARL